MKKQRIIKFAFFIALLAIVFYLFYTFNLKQYLTLAGIRSFVDSAGPLGPLVFMGVYIVATVFFLPASPLSLAGGALFGGAVGYLFDGTVVPLAIGFAVLSLLALFLICGFRIAIASQDLFSKYLVCGLVGMICMEAMVNIAVVTGMLPTKGLPLPLVSYGGTSMVMNLVACALIFHASRHGQRVDIAIPSASRAVRR